MAEYSGKYTKFESLQPPREVLFVESLRVKDGVECDVYEFVGDETQDLGIVHVDGGYKTPLQKILNGEKTIEGFIEGEGMLTVTSIDGTIAEYAFSDLSGEENVEVEIHIGEIMQWEAGESGLTFYEICTPEYADGRFEDLS